MAKSKENKNEYQKPRPPVVVVMGHVDHGKTKILDFIRNTKVMESESGGITQHIGAYEAEHKGKKITFIDTPGHEAFSAMRSRGAKVADIAVLVVAADEGVKPQTKEAIVLIKKSELPFVVAINKTDKPAADSNRVKKELAENNVLVEGWGGKIPAVEVSAKTGQNIDDLLETILLLAELEDLKSDGASSAEGLVVESHLDSRRGVTATLLLRNGELSKGDFLALGGFVESIKILENFQGKPIEKADASMPIIVSSLEHLPVIGDAFAAAKSRQEAEKLTATQETKEILAKKEEIAPVVPVSPEQKENGEESGTKKPVLGVVLKSDVAGSREALESIINALEYFEVGVKIIKSEPGEINESDIKTAQAGENIIICGFKVKIAPVLAKLAETSGIKVIVKDIIYELVDAVKAEMSELIPPFLEKTVVGRAKILAVFKTSGNRQIIGGQVLEGKIQKGLKCAVLKKGTEAGVGKIIQLQQQKKDVESVVAGLEFGVMVDTDAKIETGDILEVFEEEIIRKKL